MLATILILTFVFEVSNLLLLILVVSMKLKYAAFLCFLIEADSEKVITHIYPAGRSQKGCLRFKPSLKSFNEMTLYFIITTQANKPNV